MTEHQQLTELCGRLGADPVQAETMARQLVKRCDQLMADRAWTRPEAMAHLLRLVTQGRSGVAPAGFEGGSITPDPMVSPLSPETR